MFTKLTSEEMEELFTNPQHIKQKLSLTELTSSRSDRRIEWYKQPVDTVSVQTITGQTITLSNQQVIIYAVLLTNISARDLTVNQQIRHPLFACRREQTPVRKVVLIHFSDLVNKQGMPEEHIISTFFIPQYRDTHFTVLSEQGCLGTLFHNSNGFFFPGEVGMKIPFFPSSPKLHRECMRHGRFHAKKPMPRNLLNGAEWHNTNLERL